MNGMGKIPFTTKEPLKGDYSSKLSAHLAYGCISARRLVKEADVEGLMSTGNLEFLLGGFCPRWCWKKLMKSLVTRT